MDDWFTPHPRARRGRSAAGHQFLMQPAGPPIRALHPYDFIKCLDLQNQLIVHREANDPVYRGDVPPQEHCVWLPKRVVPEAADDSDSSRSSSPVERQSTPVTPTRGSSPAAGRIVTYSRRDRERAAAAQRARDAALQPPRRSRRLRGVVPNAYSKDTLVALGHEVVLWDPAPRPVVDRQDYVIAVVVGAPKDQNALWTAVVKTVTRHISRMFRNGDFSNADTDEPRIRLGISVGDEYAAPQEITNSGILAHEVEFMRNSAEFNILSDYHNHLYRQFAPRNHAEAATKVGELVDRRIVYPAFDRSVFTTTQIDSGNGPALSHKNYNGGLATMEILTSFGNYAYKRGGHIIFWEDEKVFELPPGASVMFPAGSKRYSFVPVAPHEKRFILRQFCHAGVLRWVEKGGRSDKEFEMWVSDAEVNAWNEQNASRGRASIKLFSKLNELSVF